MKILVTGSTGMLGTDLVGVLSKSKHDVIGCSKQNLDITNIEDIAKIKDLGPEIIINCAAYTKVDLAERERELCYSINVTGVQNLVRVCKEKKITLIHISTDYVFNGELDSYSEESKKYPLNQYGKTKSEGEDIILHGLENHYIIRTSWLFGKNGKNFVETIIKLCEEKKEVKVVNDQIGRPTYTKDLSEGIVRLIGNFHKHRYGIYHITNEGKCSWFEFAKEVARLGGLNCNIKSCTTEEFKTEAKRPKSSVLENNKTEKLRSWKEALKAYMGERQ